MIGDIHVITLDLDGVLFDGPSAAYPIAHQLGIGDRFMEIYQRLTKEKKQLEDQIREGTIIWKGVAVDGSYDSLVHNLPLMKGAEEVVSSLKKRGYEVGCISSGVSQFFMEPFKKRLDLDFAYSNVLGESEGSHDGTVTYVMGGPQKAETALAYLTERGYTESQLAAVGDGRNDIDVFRLAGFSVAFNPEVDAVSEAATVTVRSDDLRDVLPHFDRT